MSKADRPLCFDQGFRLVLRDGANPFRMSIFDAARNMHRVACSCRAGESYAVTDAYNAATIRATERATR